MFYSHLPVKPGFLVVPMALFLYLFQNKTSGTIGTSIFMGQMSIRSPNKQHQRTERNNTWKLLVQWLASSSSDFDGFSARTREWVAAMSWWRSFNKSTACCSTGAITSKHSYKQSHNHPCSVLWLQHTAQLSNYTIKIRTVENKTYD